MDRRRFLSAAAGIAGAAALPAPLRAQPSTDLAAAAVRAYLFAYPLVLVAITERGQVAFSGRNRFVHDRALATPDDRFIVRPNVDTLYSSAFVDLTDGPVLLTIPSSAGRFYVCEVMDAYTNVFADPGTRTTGAAAQQVLFVPPGRAMNPPAGMTAVNAPTNACWVFPRVALHAGADLAAAHAFQDGLGVARLGETPLPGLDHPAADPTDRNALIAKMSPQEFFTIAAHRLAGNAPEADDVAGLRDLAALGITPGNDVDLAALSPTARAAITAAPAAALAQITGFTLPPQAYTPTRWLRPNRAIGRWGGNDVLRAIVANYGLAANLPEDAIYFATAGNGTRPARLRFAAGALPPADGFWSLTMYDTAGFLVANAEQRYALRSGDPFARDRDGGLTLEIGPQPPADAARRANWLPSPAGPYTMLLRLYAPHTEAIDGGWIPPAVISA